MTAAPSAWDRAVRRVYRSRLLRPYFRARWQRGPSPLRVIVAGTPRSGTSFVAGLVHRMGFRLGPEQWLRPADQHNRFGYYECMPLTELSARVLNKLGGDFHSLPALPPGWTGGLAAEKREIVSLVEAGGIELLKDNQLLVLADLYDELFPSAKWIFTHRASEETYRSRFGPAMSQEEWLAVTERRLAIWHASRPAARALALDYADFRADVQEATRRIAAHLGLEAGDAQIAQWAGFFRPRS